MERPPIVHKLEISPGKPSFAPSNHRGAPAGTAILSLHNAKNCFLKFTFKKQLSINKACPGKNSSWISTYCRTLYEKYGWQQAIPAESATPSPR